MSEDVAMLHRTQLLFEEDQFKALIEMAQSEGRSISEIVRGLVQNEIDRQSCEREERRRRGLATIEWLRKVQFEQPDVSATYDPVAELQRAREERDEEIWVAVHYRR